MNKKSVFKALAILLVAVMIASGFVFVVSAHDTSQSNAKSSSIIYVPNDYAKIQWAVDNATAGDEIIVRDGTYYEDVEVDKQLTIESENETASCIVNGTAPGSRFPSGYTFSVKADYVTLSGFKIEGASGILLNGSYCRISNNIIGEEGVSHGIEVQSDSFHNLIADNKIGNTSIQGGYGVTAGANNTLRNNTISNFGGWGVALGPNNEVLNNSICYNPEPGIILYGSNNTLESNNISYNGEALWIQNSNENLILDNAMKESWWGNGISMENSTGNTIKRNKITSNDKNGIYLELDSSSNKITLNNISSNNATGIYLRSSSNNTINYNNISSNDEGGILLLNSSSYNNFSSNNILSNTENGIYLGSSSNNTISSNNIISNDRGIHSYSSTNNKIYLNSFNNMDNAESYNSSNSWNSTEKITYNYNGTEYTSFMGNYWSDYTGSDSDGDGIGDTPYSIDSDKDNYPLMEPWEEYLAPVPSIIDTGKPKNPYPSIFGMHNGTIIPNQTITVSKLYTYPCSGTGGHSEYVKIWNDTWSTKASWNGYKGDWHNITFPESFTLKSGETYNYTIETGSYPQIIHEKEFSATGGKITCTEFVDANEKNHDGWIPAIKLY